ncbi:MAG: FtsQ-type POTRA domain-containing protein [Oscillospiraceae bacterium]|nr:FtsQ-type POTRA domain-containing protein [Oscillospiraceae bacterium]
MAKKRNNRRRRARGRFGPLLRLMSVLLTAVVIVAALTLFFKVEKVSVSGNSRYSAEEIIAVCGVEQGDNLVLLDKYAIAQRLYTQLPYITDVRINRSFPDGLTVEVTETHAALAIESGGAWWLVSEDGKIVDATDTQGAESYLVLRGMNAQEMAIGAQLTFAAQDHMSTQRLKELVAALSERGMLERTQSIDAGDSEILRIGYEGRFDVELYYDADFDFKLDCLRAAVDELEPNETGIIRMTMKDENEVRFIPYRQ